MIAAAFVWGAAPERQREKVAKVKLKPRRPRRGGRSKRQDGAKGTEGLSGQKGHWSSNSEWGRKNRGRHQEQEECGSWFRVFYQGVQN